MMKSEVSMRIDAHQHFWHYDERQYGWIDDTAAPLKRDFTPDDLAPLLDATGFGGTVAVQARRSESENEYLLALAAKHPWILGVVGWVDIEADDLEYRIESLAENSRFRGIRELIHDMPDLDYAVSTRHDRAVGMLALHDLTYDLLLRPAHLAPATKLIDRHPDQPFVIDHLAKPDIASGDTESWYRGITEIAKRPNVSCKLSGMVTEASRDSWSASDFVPYLDHALEVFGTDRLMIGSDWPVCTLAAGYGEVMSIVIDYIASLSGSEQHAVLGANCRRFYSLERRVDTDRSLPR